MIKKEKFLLECPSFREWIDKPKLSITVPYIFHRIAEEIQQSLMYFFFFFFELFFLKKQNYLFISLTLNSERENRNINFHQSQILNQKSKMNQIMNK